jgi:hypothetical protein
MADGDSPYVFDGAGKAPGRVGSVVCGTADPFYSANYKAICRNTEAGSKALGSAVGALSGCCNALTISTTEG